jgi:phosphate transport system protein
MSQSAEQQNLYRRLKKELRSIGENLSESMQQLIEALEHRDAESARNLLGQIQDLRQRQDSSIEICLQVLAQTNGNTPELRWTGCAHKVLSLMGKSSAEIAAIAKEIAEIEKGPDLPIARDLPEMGRMASQMLQQSIRTALHPDVENARSIMETDSSLDRHKEAFMKKATAFVTDNPTKSNPVAPYVLVSRHLERIGDHASHIAEEVAYYLQGLAA